LEVQVVGSLAVQIEEGSMTTMALGGNFESAMEILLEEEFSSTMEALVEEAVREPEEVEVADIQSVMVVVVEDNASTLLRPPWGVHVYRNG
jgi:precorrin-3B methylase